MTAPRFHHRRKTRPGRLAGLDALLFRWQPALLDPDGYGGAPVADIGLGARPWTTLELADRVAPIDVIGVDIAPAVVERAREHARPGVRFVTGDLSVPTPCRLVRVLNVLRDLRADAVPAAHARLLDAVVEGGWVVEGSCAPEGEVGVVHALQRQGDTLCRRSLLFWLDGRRGTAPLAFRDRLPQDLRQDRSHAVWILLDAWMTAFRAVDSGADRLARAARAVPHLTPVGSGVVWSPPDGVPR